MHLSILAALFTGVVVLAQSAPSTCDRDWLQSAADNYVAAQAAGNASLLQYSSNFTYTQNFVTANLSASILNKALKIDHKRSDLDTTQCATYTELIITDPENPYVIGSQIRYADGQIWKMETLASTTGDWGFNATDTLLYAQVEDAQGTWVPVPQNQLTSREAIQAAGDAYLDLFLNASVVVPFGEWCTRLEGGTYFAPCDYGVPVNITNDERRYVIDEVYGTVDIFDHFAQNLPDSHELRVVNGTIRNVHTITIYEPGAPSDNTPA